MGRSTLASSGKDLASFSLRYRGRRKPKKKARSSKPKISNKNKATEMAG